MIYLNVKPNKKKKKQEKKKGKKTIGVICCHRVSLCNFALNSQQQKL